MCSFKFAILFPDESQHVRCEHGLENILCRLSNVEKHQVQSLASYVSISDDCIQLSIAKNLTNDQYNEASWLDVLLLHHVSTSL